MDKQTTTSTTTTINPLSTNENCNNQLMAQNKRKEKARIAARARRNQEANIIMEMASELHIMQEKVRRIDKATIVRLAIDYIKAFDILCRVCNTNISSTNSDDSNNNNNNNNEIIRNKVVEEIEVERKVCLYSMPKLSTSMIFTPKTKDMDLNFLMINEQNGKQSFVLKPDEEVLNEDDLTHLAPQAGEGSIPLEVEPLDGIVLDTSLFLPSSPLSSAQLGMSAASQKISNPSETILMKYMCPN